MPARIRLASTLLLLIAALSAGTASAQFEAVGPATDYVSWTARALPDSVRPAGTFRVVLDATIAPPWKMYALDSSLPPLEDGPRSYGVAVSWTDLSEDLTVVTPGEQSEAEWGRDPNFDMILGWFHDRARFAWSIDVAPTAPTGVRNLQGTVRYQICNDDRGICLPPTSVAFATSIVVDPNCSVTSDEDDEECVLDESAFADVFADMTGAGGSQSTASIGQGSAPGRPVTGSSDGLLAFLLLAVGAGLASLLTPCVFPMVPLTVSYFTKHAENRATAVRMALVFGAAIIITFTALGIIMAIVVGAAGAQTIAASPWVNLFIAAVLIGFALSLLGLYDLRMPGWLVNYSDRQGRERGGITGVLFMGLTLTLVSFSCTAPFVGGLLAAAAGGTWVWPLIGMLGFSAAFATPFVLLAVFPQALASLPKSGSWMNVLKVVLGFIELAAALKFLSNADLVWGWEIVSRPLAIAITIVIFIVTGLYLLGKIRLPHDEPSTVGIGRLMAAIAFIATGLYMVPGLLGAPLNSLDAFLPPRQATDISLLASTGGDSNLIDPDAWIVDDIDAALAEATAVSRPVFIDFTGYTCTNCRQMEANVFPLPGVRERFERDFVLLRLHTDGLELGSEFQRYQLRLTGTVALPTYAVLDVDGRTLLGRASGMMDGAEFVSFLDRASAGRASRP